MKRLVIYFTIFLSSLSLFAQDIEKPKTSHCTLDPANFSTSVFLAPAWSWYDFDRNAYTASSSSPGYSIGVREEYKSNQYLSFGIEGEIVHTRYSFESRYDASGSNHGTEDAFKHILTTTMFNIPVYMKVNIPYTQKVSYYATGGIGLSYMVGGSSEVDQILPTIGEPAATSSRQHLNMPTNGFFMPASGYYTFSIGSEIKLNDKKSLLIEVKSRSEMNYRAYQYIMEQPGAATSVFGIREHSLSLGLGLKF